MLPANHFSSPCWSGALQLALACVASAALGAAAVAAVALLAGERRRRTKEEKKTEKSVVVVEKKKAAEFSTKPAVAAAATCCGQHHEHDENAAPSSPRSSSSAPSSKGDPFDARPRSSYLSWDDYFMALAFLSAQRSKDPNKQVGACIVSRERIILGIGYNGFPRGCADSKLPWAKKAASGGALATKYPYVCHAEMNAVLNKNAASVAGATLYVTMFPCNECSKLLIQAGIGEVVFYEDKQQQQFYDGSGGGSGGSGSGGGGSGGAGGSGRPASPFAAGGILPAESYAASRTLLALAGVRTRQHAPAEALVLRVPPLDEAAAAGKKKKIMGGGGVLRDAAAAFKSA